MCINLAKSVANHDVMLPFANQNKSLGSTTILCEHTIKTCVRLINILIVIDYAILVIQILV